MTSVPRSRKGEPDEDESDDDNHDGEPDPGFDFQTNGQHEIAAGNGAVHTPSHVTH